VARGRAHGRERFERLGEEADEVNRREEARSHDEIARQEARGEEEGDSRNAVSVWAVLAAAGSGERLGADRPKAFVRLGDRPLLAESLERLEASEWIDAIVIAAPPGWEEPSILLAEELGCGKVSACVAGGATRAESVLIGLAEVAEAAAVVVVHDAARPLLVDDVLGRVLGGLNEGWDGAVPALPVADTIKRVEGEQV